MNKKTLIIVGGIAAALFLCVCVAVVGFMGYRIMQQSTDVAPTPFAIDEIQLPSPTEAVVEVIEPEPTEVVVVEEGPVLVPEVETGELNVDDARYVAGYFVLALSDEDYETAVSFSVNDMRNNPDTVEQLRDIVEGQGLKPLIWEWLEDNPNGELMDFVGVINFADDRRGSVEVQTTYEEGEWRVNYIDLKTDGESVDPGPLSSWNDQRTTEELAFAMATADYFILNWIDQDWDNAFLLSSEAMQTEVGSADKIEEVLGSMGVTPDTWTWDSHSFVEPEGMIQPVIELVGTINYVEGSRGPITVQLTWENGFWSVLFFDVKAE